MNILSTILRFVVAALLLMFLGYIVPGFSHLSFLDALMAAIVIAAASYFIGLLLGRGATTYSRGIVGFLVSAAVIWLAQFVIVGMQVTWLGALIAAAIIGLVDLFIPTAIR